jgi:hypothetical protein
VVSACPPDVGPPNSAAFFVGRTVETARRSCRWSSHLVAGRPRPWCRLGPGWLPAAPPAPSAAAARSSAFRKMLAARACSRLVSDLAICPYSRSQPSVAARSSGLIRRHRWRIAPAIVTTRAGSDDRLSTASARPSTATNIATRPSRSDDAPCIGDHPPAPCPRPMPVCGAAGSVVREAYRTAGSLDARNFRSFVTRRNWVRSAWCDARHVRAIYKRYCTVLVELGSVECSLRGPRAASYFTPVEAALPGADARFRSRRRLRAASRPSGTS